MYNNNEPIASVAKQETDVERILKLLSEQNSRLVGNIQILETLGHRLRDTGGQEKQMTAETPKPLGVLDEIGRQLEYYITHNCRLENIISKFQSLL